MPSYQLKTEKIKCFQFQMNHLERCLKSRTESDTRQIAGILRVLLIDGSPLYQQINREFGKKIRFVVGNHLGDKSTFLRNIASGVPLRFPVPIEGIVGHGFRVGAAGTSSRPGPVRQVVDYKQFLGLVVALSAGQPISVLEVIQNLAYVDGVVHAGLARTQTDSALLAQRENFQIGGSPMLLLTLEAIGTNVYGGLRDLLDAVLSRYGP